jgi:hypothetical protein
MSAWERLAELDGTLAILWKAKETLRAAWEMDLRFRKTYPINTSHALTQIRESLLNRGHQKKKRVRMKKPKTPNTLAELIPEKLVRAIWDENHAGSLKGAIARASGFGDIPDKQSWKAFLQISRTMEIAYKVNRFGHVQLRTPKVAILHSGLDRITKAAGQTGQSDQGFTEFLNDLCPCGLKQHRGAVGKMRGRSRKAG